MPEAAVFSVDLPLEWRRAANDVVACALAYRLRLQAQGVPTQELDGVFELQRIIYAAVGDARRVMEDPIECYCGQLPHRCRCRQHAIVVSVSMRVAKRFGKDVDEVEEASLERLDTYLDNRS